MKKILNTLKEAVKATGLFLWKNKRNIGIVASTFILPAVNAHFPNAMTPEQYQVWFDAAKGLAVLGVGHSAYNEGKKRIQKQNRKGD